MKLEWSHRRRLFTAMEHGEPDRVPVTDLHLDPPIIESILGRGMHGFSAQDTSRWDVTLKNVMAKIEAYRKMDFDAVSLVSYEVPSRDYEPEFIEENVYVDGWGRVMKVNKDTRTTWWIDGTIKTEEDLEEYNPPQADAPGRVDALESIMKNVEEDLPVMALIQSGFVIAWEARGGIDKFIYDVYSNPRFAHRLLSKVSDACLRISKLLMEYVDMIVLGDDYADSHGPFLNPDLFRKIELPFLKRVVDEGKRRGKQVVKHSDGNLYPILGDLVDSGISGLHPMEPECMDIADVKKRFGDRIFLMGNVDCRHVLPYGSEGDVRAEVRRVIDEASEGGGHILTSSNTLHSNVKIENIHIMVDECRKYGRYPLRRREK